MKNVDVDEPTSFRDHVYLGRIQRECKVNENVIEISTKKCLNHVFLLEQLKNYQGGKNLTQRPVRGHTTWKDTLKRALRGIVNWQTKREREQLYKVSTPDHNFKEQFATSGEFSDVSNCLNMFLLGSNW